MAMCFFLACMLAALEGVSAFHGTYSSLQQAGAEESTSSWQTAFNEAVAKVETLPAELPAFLSEQITAEEPSSKISVPPLIATGDQDRVGIALPELKIQGFGLKVKDSHEQSFASPAAITKGGDLKTASVENFFQFESEQHLEKGSSSGSTAAPLPSDTSVFPTKANATSGVHSDLADSSGKGGPLHLLDVKQAPRQVGEVVADAPALPQDKGTSSDLNQVVGFVAAAELPPALSEVLPLPFKGTSSELNQVVGFVAADKAPPALSEVLPLPFKPDRMVAPEVLPVPFKPDGMAAPASHTHVEANIATQELNVARTDASVLAATPTLLDKQPKAKANISKTLEEQHDAWTHFAAAEALSESSRGHSHEDETAALGTDTIEAAALLPIAAPKEEVSAATKEMLAALSLPRAAPSMAEPATDEVATGTLASRGSQVFWIFGAVALVGSLCLASACVSTALSLFQKHNGTPTPRSQVEDLPLCRASEVDRHLPCTGSYDCTFSKPISSRQLLRIEARVEGPIVGSTALTTPLTGQACVLFSVAVSRQLHDGIRPAPVAFASGSVDFVISLKDAPSTRINVCADELSLFDMCLGRRIQRQTFGAATDKWQDFILTHRAGTEWQTSTQMRSDSSCLEFQECALLCGTVATFVGELHRGSDGVLSLRALQQDSLAVTDNVQGRSSGKSERWLTSWESGACEANNVASPVPTPRETDKGDRDRFAKVLASDDPLLLDDASWSLSSMSAMLGRLHKQCSNRAMSFANQYRGGKRTGGDKNLVL